MELSITFGFFFFQTKLCLRQDVKMCSELPVQFPPFAARGGVADLYSVAAPTGRRQKEAVLTLPSNVV